MIANVRGFIDGNNAYRIGKLQWLLRACQGFQVDRTPKYFPTIAFHYSSRYAQLRRGRGSCQMQTAIDRGVRYLQQFHSCVPRCARTALPRGTKRGSGHTHILVCTTPTNLDFSQILQTLPTLQRVDVLIVINKIEHSWA